MIWLVWSKKLITQHCNIFILTDLRFVFSRKALTWKYYAKKILYYLRQQKILNNLKAFLQHSDDYESYLEGKTLAALSQWAATLCLEQWWKSARPHGLRSWSPVMSEDRAIKCRAEISLKPLAVSWRDNFLSRCSFSSKHERLIFQIVK